MNTTVKFFWREDCLSKSRNLFSGRHHIWWPNVSRCWSRSSQIECTYFHKNSQRHSYTSFNTLCEIWGLKMQFSTYKPTNTDFCSFERDNCDAKPCETLSQKPANSDVTLSDIYFNLLEFWIPRHCECSGTFCTSLKNVKKICSFKLTMFFTGSLIFWTEGWQVPQETFHEWKFFKLLVTHSNS